MSDRFQCDVCGRFISLDDLSSGKAIRRLVTPDSAFTAEDYEMLCKEHHGYLVVANERTGGTI